MSYEKLQKIKDYPRKTPEFKGKGKGGQKRGVRRKEGKGKNKGGMNERSASERRHSPKVYNPKMTTILFKNSIIFYRPHSL